jgi:hypothetical protein
MATERLYLDPQGKYRKGYIIDGKTYVDPEGKIRVPIGSQTQADSGQWYQLTESGGVAIPADQSYVGKQLAAQNQSGGGTNDYISGIANARAQARINALEQAYKQSISALNQQKSEIPQIFTDARNRAAGQYETQRANFNRYAANTGLNVGTAGQAQLAMGTTYQGNLGQLDRAEIKAITDINTQLSNLAAKYRSEVAQAQAEGDYDRMTMLYQQYQNEQNILRQQQQRQQDIDMTTAENRAKLLASMGDFSGYQQLYDLDPTQTAALSALWKQQNAPKYTGGGGGGGGGSSSGTSAESGIIANMLALGDDAKAYEYLVGLGLAAGITDMLYKFYKEQRLAQQSTAGANVSYVPSASSAAVGTVDTQSVVTAVKGLLKKGKSTDYAKNYIADLYDMGMITTSQVSTIMQQLGI